MKLRLLALNLFLLTAPFAFSQHIQVENGDTMAVIPIEQIRQANVIFIERDSLQAEVTFYQRAIAAKDSLIEINRLMIQTQADELQLQERRVSLFQTAFKDCKKESKQARTKTFLMGIGAGAILDIGIRLLALIL